jgi:hypothetical protein
MQSHKTLGLFGDSYTIQASSPTRPATWGAMLAQDYDLSGFGKNGSNLFYSINQWRTQVEIHGPDFFNYVIFAFSWHNRLYSSDQERNNYFCQPLHPMHGLTDTTQLEQVNQAVEQYNNYIYDDRWCKFDYELELQYVLDLPKQHTKTKFVFLPNTEFARGLAKQHFHTGVLVDFAFETLSNREVGSPGPMPVRCGRTGHLNLTNHAKFADVMRDILYNYDQHANTVYNFDMNQFDVVRDDK